MNIGFCYSSFERVTGIPSVVFNTINALKEIDGSNNYISVQGKSSKVDLPTINCPKCLRDNEIVPSFILNDYKVDIIHSFYPAFDSYIKKAKYVLTIHDVIPLIHPEWFRKEVVDFFDGPLRKSAARADLIIADSKSTKQDIAYYYGIDDSKIEVVYIGLSSPLKLSLGSTGTLTKYSIEGDYILTVSTLSPRKNLRKLVQAYHRYRRSNKRNCVKLVIAGGKGWDVTPDDWLQELGEYKKDVVITGYITDEELSDLYRNATAVAYVSLYEGFGLPILEGMSAGKAVICSDITSMPEVGGDAVCYCSPYSVESIENAIARVLEDEEYRIRLERSAYERSMLFDYKNTAKHLLQIYSELYKA